MTKAQDVYNEFIICKVVCPSCKKDVSFQQIVEWGHESGQFKCPFCRVLVKHADVSGIDKSQRLALLDKMIIDEIMEFAVDGKLHHHAASEDIIWAALASVEKRYKVAPTSPLSYVARMFIIELYRRLAEDGSIIEPDFYQVQAPIPVDIEGRAKVAPITHYGSSQKKKQQQQQQMTIGGMGGSAPQEGSAELLSMLDDLLGEAKEEGDKDEIES